MNCDVTWTIIGGTFVAALSFIISKLLGFYWFDRIFYFYKVKGISITTCIRYSNLILNPNEISAEERKLISDELRKIASEFAFIAEFANPFLAFQGVPSEQKCRKLAQSFIALSNITKNEQINFAIGFRKEIFELLGIKNGLGL